ncbi:sodium- and chloride-dependent glycine transporter 1-like [Phlebotomus argentipes]|uniref:sodium- and chloride-dependent glycine transporter 1-like n=1 Tax=Phlebotomus argentipes TaxID=94469 RepID=UPI0028930F7E|nr:sodium- and chloride-dependent glycine transporter 1-like [Phlebotomus argentipes]
MTKSYEVNSVKTIDGKAQSNGNVEDASAKAPASPETEVKRGNWGTPLEFILACIGYAVGLGNVWRFPYLVFRNGGGAFLIPFIIMVIVIGLPIFFSELFIGQYSGLGPNKAYARMAPLFEGLGACTLLVITFITIYYMVIVSWILFYLFASFKSELDWGYCNHDYNSHKCFSTLEDMTCKEGNNHTAADLIYWNQTCTDIETICSNHGLTGKNASFCIHPENKSEIAIGNVIDRVLASEEYYNEYVLGVGDATWTNWGYPRWQLVLCLLLAWIIAFFCIIKGIQSAGKVVYFTALFPYVTLTALLIRGATLEGAIDGIIFYMNPEWDRLLSPRVWADAASQTFYSFGIACASLVTFASYNQFKNNCHIDAILVSTTNVLTAVFAGFAIFSILGFMAHNMNVSVASVATEGPGLAFIAYPEAVLMMPLPQLWAVCFFFMMFILGMGSQFGGIEAINTAIIDRWPHLREHKWRVTAGTCLFCFTAALPMTCNGGVYMFTLMEWHTASWAVLMLGFAEIVIISWVYGLDRAFSNLASMGMKFNRATRGYWWIVWTIATPIGAIGIFIFTMTDIKRLKYRDYVYPAWADALGWIMGAITLVPFPLFIVLRYAKDKLTLKEFFQPSRKWGPQETTSLQDELRTSSLSSMSAILKTNGIGASEPI